MGARIQTTRDGQQVTTEIGGEKTVIAIDPNDSPPRAEIERDGEIWRLEIDRSDREATVEFYDASEAVPDWLELVLSRYGIEEVRV